MDKQNAPTKEERDSFSQIKKGLLDKLRKHSPKRRHSGECLLGREDGRKGIYE